jgi:transposase
MRGSDERSGVLFSYVDLEDRVPAAHPLRLIRRIVNEVLAALDGEFTKLYADAGRPSIAPERLLRALLLQVFYTIRSERQLMEQLDYNLLYRWFVGLGVDEAVWVPTVFTKNRERLLAAEVAHKFLAALLNHKEVRGLLSDDHFSVDGTQIAAWASMKSFRAKDGSDEPPSGGRNGERDFHGETRSNDTHASATDPEAKLYRKGKGKEAKLSYIGNALTENRHRLVVEAELGPATGTIERQAAMTMVARYSPGSRRLTLGADKAYDVHEFVDDLRDLNVTPHIAQNTQPQLGDRRPHDVPPRLRDQSAEAQANRGAVRLGRNDRRARPADAAGRRTAWDSSSPSQWQPTTSSGCPNCSVHPRENGIHTGRPRCRHGPEIVATAGHRVAGANFSNLLDQRASSCTVVSGSILGGINIAQTW